MNMTEGEPQKVEDLDARTIREVMHEYAEVTGGELLHHWEDDGIACATARIQLSGFTIYNIELMWIGCEGLGALEYASESQKARKAVLEMLQRQVCSYNMRYRRMALADAVEAVGKSGGVTQEIDEAISGLLHAIAKELLDDVPDDAEDHMLYRMIDLWRAREGVQ